MTAATDTALDALNRDVRHAVVQRHRSDAFTGCQPLTDDRDRRLWNLRHAVVIALCVAALGMAVGDVVSVRSRKDVRGIAAWRVVAPVQAARLTCWQWSAVCQDPRDDMRRHPALPIKAELAVAILIPPTAPQPALVRTAHVNLGPESVLHLAASRIDRALSSQLHQVAMTEASDGVGAAAAGDRAGLTILRSHSTSSGSLVRNRWRVRARSGSAHFTGGRA